MSSEPRLHSHWLHASGGLIWHLRALRYRNTLWQDFRVAVRGWLHRWQPPADKLLIVGPSGGYTLDSDFLQGWREVAVLEPDPLARWLLRWRYPTVRWRFENLNVLSGKEGFDVLTTHFAEHAVLFSNVLGQMTPRDEHAALEWNLDLRNSLRAHHWASYHDVISTQRVPDGSCAPLSTSGMGMDQVIGHFWQGGEVEVVDHYSFGLGQPAEHTSACCVWPLRPGHYHLVEWQQREPAAEIQAEAETPATKDCDWMTGTGGS